MSYVKSLAQELRDRGSGDIADGYEDKTERGRLDLRAAHEIERLRSALALISEGATPKGPIGEDSRGGELMAYAEAVLAE